MKSLFFALLLLSGFAASAQMANPVKWNYTIEKVSDKVYEVKIIAIIDKGWHLYAQDAGDGPEPTTITFENNPMFKLDGAVKEIGKLRKEYDPNFDSELKFYSNEVTFVQRITMRSNVATVVKGNVNFMVCNDRKCLPPKDVPFTVKVPAK